MFLVSLNILYSCTVMYFTTIFLCKSSTQDYFCFLAGINKDRETKEEGSLLSYEEVCGQGLDLSTSVPGIVGWLPMLSCHLWLNFPVLDHDITIGATALLVGSMWVQNVFLNIWELGCCSGSHSWLRVLAYFANRSQFYPAENPVNIISPDLLCMVVSEVLETPCDAHVCKPHCWWFLKLIGITGCNIQACKSTFWMGL